ncbi:MFS transporter [Deinococcus pimensis]|uniref:MFS transporter n=1 Tax=Deinococcus pimensis TaxID=309888 RepID=UPI0004B21F99|nr:MFS transporter [Deinococcus pimensis]
MYAVMRHRNYRLLWFGEFVSLLGDRALLVALPYFVYQQTNSTLATALLALTHYLPGLLLGSFAGVLADRWDRRRILVAVNVAQALVILLLLLAPSPGLLWVAYAVTLAEHTLGMLVMPAAGALLPVTVPEASRPQANALIGVCSTVARIVGPLLGGVVIAAGGLGSVVVLDAASFALAALLFSLLRVPRAQDAPGSARASLVETWRALAREWREGVSEITRRRTLLALFVTMNVTSFGGTLVDPFWVAYVRTRLQGGPEAMGLLSTTGACGALVAGLVMAGVSARVPLRALVGYGTVLVGAVMVTLYHQSSLSAALALVFVMGFPLIVSNVAASTLIQNATPDRLRGRVYGALGTTNAFVGVLAVSLAALVGERAGVVTMLTLAGAITAVAGVVGLLLLPRTDAADGRTAEGVETA